MAVWQLFPIREAPEQSMTRAGHFIEGPEYYHFLGSDKAQQPFRKGVVSPVGEGFDNLVQVSESLLLGVVPPFQMFGCNEEVGVKAFCLKPLF